MGDACAYRPDRWYLADPGNSGFPADYMACEDGGELYSKCAQSGCTCRQLRSAKTANGSTLSFVECVLLSSGEACDGTACPASGGSASIASASGSEPSAATAAPVATTVAPAATTAPTSTAVTTDSPAATVAASSAEGSSSSSSSSSSSGLSAHSASGSAEDASPESSYRWESSYADDSAETGSSASASAKKTIVASVIIGVGVLFVALVCYFIRSYCKRRAEALAVDDGPSTAAARRTPAFDGREPPLRAVPTNSRSRAGSRPTPRSSARSSAPRAAPQLQQQPRFFPSQASSGSLASGDSQSSGGSVFSSAVTNRGAAAFSAPRSTVSSISTLNDTYASTQRPRPPRPRGFDIPESRAASDARWSALSDDSDVYSITGGAHSMASEFSDIDGRSTRFDPRETTASTSSYFSEDSDWDARDSQPRYLRRDLRELEF